MRPGRLLLLLFFILFLSNTVFSQGRHLASFQAWAPAPPMGWNSWDCFGPTVTEAEVKANADYMSKYMRNYGWQYIIVDIRWYMANDKAHGYNQTDPKYSIDEYGRFIPSVERFPSAANGKGFKPLADYIHRKGLKFGIHVMRGVPVVAVRQQLPIMRTKFTAKDIYSEKDQCRWLKDMYTIVREKDGAQEYYNSLFRLYASWGVDFVKVDDLSAPIYHADEIEMIRKAIDGCGRKMLLSTSPGETPEKYAEHIQLNANMWRTVDDFWDNWKDLKAHFDVFRRWNMHKKSTSFSKSIQGVNRGWPDGDMLPLGHIGIRAERGDNRMSLFTKDEQYTLMTLWCIFRSPLMFGGHLPDNDSFTLSLLTNKNVLYVLNNSENSQEISSGEEKIIWIAEDKHSKDKFIAVFNASENDEESIPVDLVKLGYPDGCMIQDLWTGKNLGKFRGQFSPSVRKHGAGLFRAKKINN